MIILDSCGRHNIITELQQALNESGPIKVFTTVRDTSADPLVVSKIKDAWSARWEAKKAEMVSNGQCPMKKGSSWSGKIKNHTNSGRRSAACISQRDVVGLT